MPLYGTINFHLIAVTNCVFFFYNIIKVFASSLMITAAQTLTIHLVIVHLYTLPRFAGLCVVNVSWNNVRILLVDCMR